MSDIKEDIKILKRLKKTYNITSYGTAKLVVSAGEAQAIENILNRLEQDERVIEEMAEQLVGLAIWDNEKEEPIILIQEKEVIDHFRKKCE